MTTRVEVHLEISRDALRAPESETRTTHATRDGISRPLDSHLSSGRVMRMCTVCAAQDTPLQLHMHLHVAINSTTYIHLTATWFYGHIGRPDAAQVGRCHLCDAAIELIRHQLEEVATP